MTNILSSKESDEDLFREYANAKFGTVTGFEYNGDIINFIIFLHRKHYDGCDDENRMITESDLINIMGMPREDSDEWIKNLYKELDELKKLISNVYSNIVTQEIPIEQRNKELKFKLNDLQKVLIVSDLKWLYSKKKKQDCEKSVIGWFARIDVKLVKKDNGKLLTSKEIYSILNSSSLISKLTEIANKKNNTLVGRVLDIRKKLENSNEIIWEVVDTTGD